MAMRLVDALVHRDSRNERHPSFGLGRRGRGQSEEMTEWFRHSLAFPPERPAKELARKLVTISDMLIETHFPQLGKPSQPTEIIVNYDTLGLETRYAGTFRGKHYLGLGTSRKVFERLQHAQLTLDDPDVIKLVMSLTHERVHQRHAELVGQQKMRYPWVPMDEIDQELHAPKHLSARDIFIMAKEAAWRKYHPEASFSVYDMKDVVQEGIATLVQTNLYEMEAKRLERRNPQAAVMLRKEGAKLTERVNMYHEGVKTDGWRAWGFFSYAIGYYVMAKIFGKDFSKRQDVAAVLKKIDLQQMHGIEEGSPEWANIISNPQKYLLGENFTN